MAKKASIKKMVVKSAKEEKDVESPLLDVSEETLILKAAAREYLPSVTYVNNYQTKDRGKVSEYTVDFSELVNKYPKNKALIEQLIIGMNECLIPDCSKTTIDVNATGIRIFIEFLNSDNNLSNNSVTNVSDINILVAQSFSNFLRSTYPKEGRNRKWFAAIRRNVQRLQELFSKEPSIGVGFPWPNGPGKKEGTIDGYHPREMKELINACIEDIKNIKNFHKAYLSINEELETAEWNIENIMYYLYESMLKTRESYLKSRQTEKGWIKKLISRSPNAQSAIIELGYTIEQIQDLYIQRGIELASGGRNPFPTRISQRPDQERAISQFNLALGTLKKQFPLFPYYLPIEEAKRLLNTRNTNLTSQNELESLVNNSVWSSCGKIKFMDGTLGKMAVYAAKHFVTDTLYPFFLLALINTGWNVESLLSISDDVDAHITPDLIDPENYVIIHGRKVRGSNGKEYLKVTRRSNKNKMLDTYQLLKYVESIITQYRNSPYYRSGLLWQFTLPEFQKDLISSFNEHQSLTLISKRFVNRHKFKYFSDTTGISHPKVRSGYVTIKQLLGESEYQLSDDISHNDLGTIDYYTSDESTNLILDLKIKEIQKQFIKDLTNFKVRIVESTSLRSLRDAINEAKTEREKLQLIKKEAANLHLNEDTIVHLLDAGSQKYILACEDSMNPSWPGCDDYVREGEKCKHFNKCALCKQAIVFPETLPYIARRILDLDKLKKSLSSSDWVLQYGDEYDAWNKILEYWNNEDQVKEAWDLARMGFVVLPQIMRGV